MNLKNLKIATQLKLTFAFLLLFVLILGVVSYRQSVQIHAQTETIYNHPLQVRQAIGKFHIDVSGISSNIRMLHFETEKNGIEYYLNQTDSLKSDAFAQIDILYGNYLGSPTEVDSLKQSFLRLNAYHLEEIRQLRAQMTENAIAKTLFLGGERKMMVVLAHLQKIDHFASHKGDFLVAQSREILNSLNTQLIILVSVILLFSLLICYILIRNINQPLEDLTNATRRFHENEMNVRSTYPYKNEFGVLSDSFNSMAAQIKTHLDEKEKRAAELFVANKELVFQNSEKEKQAAELLIANKELETFSYSVSHDLRAPLRHINGFVDLLLRRYFDSLPEKARYYLDNIAGSSRQMGTLIDDLLQFSRIGRQEMQCVKLDMNGLVQEVLEMTKQDNPTRNIEWHIAPLPGVYGDQALLRLVWINLLSNAVKFTGTRRKAVIGINVLDEKEHFIFSVHDNGVGFDMQYAQKLFGVFQRMHPADEFEGTGIGLANVHHIIAKHGGLAWAEAEQDQGATFYFSLPKRP